MPNDSIGRPNPFLIPELFHCVLECLVTSLPQRPGPSRLEQRTLAALARTCRAFSRPSLDYLWRCLSSLLPLIRCFSDVVNRHRIKIPPTPLEWLIIKRYSPRIQELTLGDEPLSLCFLTRAGPDLPSLRIFRLKCPPFNSRSLFYPLTCMWPLFSPTIDALEVEATTQDDPTYLSFLHSYSPFLCPGLKSLKLSLPDAPVHESIASVPHTLSRAICSNAHWRHVSLSSPIDFVILKYLGMSSTLETASLKLAPQTSRPETCFEAEDIPFRNVTDLALMLGNSLDFVTCILRPRDQAFRSFRVTIWAVAFASEVFTLLTALISPQRIHSLSSLTINHIPCLLTRFSIEPPETSALRRLNCETLRPLASLVHLRKLVLHLDNSMSINDREFADLVSHWPLIEVLKMTWVHEGHPVASITLNGLLSLLASCQRLRKVGLTLDARVVPTGDYPHSDLCRPSITSPLTVCDAPLHRPDLVAQFLTRHLPRIPGVHLTWSSHLYEPYAQSWSQVNEHMNSLFSRGAPRGINKFAILRRLWGCLRRPDDDGRTAVDVYQLEDYF